MTADRQSFQRVLSRLVKEHGVPGVEIIQRDGQCVLECYRQDLDLSTYSRLSATLAAAGESVLPELRATRAEQIVSEADDDHNVVVVPANERFLIAALTESDQSSDELIEALRDAARDIGRLGLAA